MPVKNSFDKKATSDFSGNGRDAFSFLMKPVVLGVITFCLLAFLFSLLIYQRYALLKEVKIKEAYEIVNQAKDKLQETLTYSLSATKTLTFFIDNNGQVKDFDSIAAQILEAGTDIDAIQLVPGGVIRYVYPLKGNEKVVGYDVLNDSTRNKEAYKAIEKKQMFFAGPFELRQGGMGVVGRLPVYRKNKFWGFSAVVIRMSTLFKTAGIDSISKNGFYFQLSKINPDTKAEEYFLPIHKDQAKGQSVSVRVPNGEWKLSVIRVEPYSGFGDIALLALLGFLLSLSGAVIVYRIAIRPRMLASLVKEQTIDLKKSENKYRSVIERVSDAFVAIDKDWVYTYVNEKAGEIFARDPKSLVGKNIWIEFPEWIDKPFYHTYYRAMETQEYQYLEEYYSPYGKWFENHIYPSKDGLTVFFKDVTEIKKISLALKENEEKYRSLIEQASDGIVISDLDGYILEVNKSIALMSGYSIEEMEGEHLYRFLPEEDATLNPLRFKELMEGKSLLSERRLLKKNGTTLDIEVNSKMASSQTMIGFIRDITERKKNENILRYQARLLESVSDAITSLDINRCIVSWNQACEDLYGFTTEEVMGKRIPELVTFEFPGTTQEEVFKQVFSEGKWKGEFNFIHPKTNIKTHLLSSINLLKNMEGEISGFIITSKDISDLKQAADKLEKRETQLLASIENTPNIAVQWYNDKGEILYWNHASELMYGWTPGEAAGKTLDQLIQTPEEAADFLKTLEEVARTGSTIGPSEYEFRRRDGAKGFCMATIFSIPADEGELCFVCMDVDITERKKAEEEILISRRQFQNLVENISGVYWVNNLETYETLYISPSYETIWGLKCESLYKNPADFINAVHPEDKEFIFEAHKNIAGTHKANLSYRIIRPDGEIRWISANTNVVVTKGNKIEYGYAEDITDRKKAEETLVEKEKKLQQVLSSTADNFYVIDPDYTVVLINKVAERNLEIAWGRSVKPGTNLLDVIPDKGEEPIKENFEKAFTGERIEYEMNLSHPGLPTWVMIYFTPVINESGTIIGVSVVAKDISERKKAEELLHKSYEDIRQLASNLQSIREDERTNIAREIHDELGQQLTGLKMDLHWLTRKINSTDAEVTDKMKESIELINATIASVRKISTDLRPSILDDLGLIAALEWQSEEFEKRSGTRVEFTNKAGEITVKPAVTTAVFRIYQELLTNIARHANADQVTALLKQDNNRLYFRVTDNGTGFNLESISNKKTLGLLGIKERTLLLGGTYEFKSKPGEGSETIISIPLTGE
jgi:PAS domain S-box-containing protein